MYLFMYDVKRDAFYELARNVYNEKLSFAHTDTHYMNSFLLELLVVKKTASSEWEWI